MSFISGWDISKIPSDRDIILAFDDMRVLFDNSSKAFVRWRENDSLIDMNNTSKPVYIGGLDGTPVFLFYGSPPERYAGLMCDTRQVFFHLQDNEIETISAGRMTNHWLENNQYCGRCGSPLSLSAEERVLVCPDCTALHYPGISPAVIAAVFRDGKILLGRNRRFPGGMFSLIAGFVDAGETVESAVKREIREETGIEVCDIRYLGSQAWPFPNSLMLGFSARYLSGELCPDKKEIVECGWFDGKELPSVPPPGSIARKILENFFPYIKENAKKEDT